MNKTSCLIDFFDKTFVINLPERQDRRREISQELERIGSSATADRVVIFPAIKPTELADFPSLGARGCFLSHLAILREASDQRLKRVLIVEDDLVFSNLLIQQQEIIVNQLQQPNWDLVYLGHLVEQSAATKIKFEPYTQPLQQSHCIGVNEAAIAPLVKFLETVLSRPAGHPNGGPMHVDGAYTTFRQQHPRMVTWIANPSLGFQRPSPSDIAGYRWFDHLPVLTPVVSTMRKVKTWYQR
jgi:glycosyl transferase, family 25